MDFKEVKYQSDPIDVPALREAVEASKRQRKFNEKSVTMKVLLIGGNFVVHKFLCAYVALASKDATIFDGIDLAIYVVPAQRNDISTFLARSDKWYRRHIFYPFVGPIGVCPQVRCVITLT